MNICKAVKEAGVFSLLVDEDASKVEKLAIILRYVDVKAAAIYERFLTYVSAPSLTAESLTKYILDTLRKHDLEPNNIVSQGYDGASDMSGSISGVQARIREIAPRALYVHCNAHCLNLVLVDSIKAVRDASEFFSLLETLYVFLSSAKCHAVFLEKQKDLYPNKQVRQLQRLSETRTWACRQGAITPICYTLDAVVMTLQDVVDGNDGERAAQARGLLLQVKYFRFLLWFMIFDRILSSTKCLSDALQGNQLDLAKAADLVSSTTETVQEFKTDCE